jgi:lauroyl/myristoyl acyltransferase
MDRSLYVIARLLVGLLQALPLTWVAVLGRCTGEVVFWLDGRHRKVAMRNLTLCFAAVKSPKEIRALAHENFRRIGENYCCAIKTAAMNKAQIKQVMQVSGAASALAGEIGTLPASCVYATGHFGNFELFTRLSMFMSGYRFAGTYRGLRQPALNRLILSMRTVPGNVLYERRAGAEALKKAMKEGGMLLVLVADQSAPEDGLELPFFGRNCCTNRAPAVMAMRYNCDLFVPICYRTGLGSWRIEVGEAIPTRVNGERRSTEAVTRDVNSAMETAVRRDPANWFWVHNRWKPRRERKIMLPVPA